MAITCYLFLLLLAHVLGDFYFQTEKIAKEKDECYRGIVKHALEYLMVSLCTMLPVMNIEMLLTAVALSFMHYFIDSAKYMLIKNKRINDEEHIFIMDQLCHITSIVILAYLVFTWNIAIASYKIFDDIFIAYGIKKMVLLRWGLAILCLHKPANTLIQKLLTKYKPQDNENAQIITTDHKAGRKIGTLERMIMLMFIAMDQYAALGLVLTAKSIARYDKIAKNERFAEYYLLGTLLSTACVVGCKLLFL